MTPFDLHATVRHAARISDADDHFARHALGHGDFWTHIGDKMKVEEVNAGLFRAQSLLDPPMPRTCLEAGLSSEHCTVGRPVESRTILCVPYDDLSAYSRAEFHAEEFAAYSPQCMRWKFEAHLSGRITDEHLTCLRHCRKACEDSIWESGDIGYWSNGEWVPASRLAASNFSARPIKSSACACSTCG